MKINQLFSAQATIGNFAGTNCLTISKKSIEDLLYERVPHGPDYHAAIIAHAQDIATDLMPALTFRDQPTKIAIVEIPRGGVPCAEGVKLAFDNMGYDTDIISSRCKSDTSALFDADMDWGQYQGVILTDGVIGSGKTIVQHLEQIPEALQEHTIVFANVTSALGARTIAESAPAKAVLVTGLLLPEEDCQWMQFPDKSVYFIGYNEERGVDLKLPDFGDAIQPQPRLTA